MRIKSGGGITSNKYVTSRSSQKVEPVTHRGNVAGVAQTGLSHAFKPEPMFQGKGYEPQKMPATGVKGRVRPKDGSKPASQSTPANFVENLRYGPAQVL